MQYINLNFQSFLRCVLNCTLHRTHENVLFICWYSLLTTCQAWWLSQILNNRNSRLATLWLWLLFKCLPAFVFVPFVVLPCGVYIPCLPFFLPPIRWCTCSKAVAERTLLLISTLWPSRPTAICSPPDRISPLCCWASLAAARPQTASTWSSTWSPLLGVLAKSSLVSMQTDEESR